MEGWLRSVLTNMAKSGLLPISINNVLLEHSSVHPFMCVLPLVAFVLPQLCWVGFPGGSVVKNMPASAGDSGSIPESGRSTGEGNSNPLGILAWKILWTEEPGEVQVHRVTKESDTTFWLNNNKQGWVAVAETVWSAKSKVVTIWTFTESSPTLGLDKTPVFQVVWFS